jgi:site-specific DNA recombinase
MKPMTIAKPNVEIIRPVVRRDSTLRIAPYCRVSSSSEDQLHSYAAQIDYYTKLVSANPDWELMDVYADEGISGTAMDKRDDLNRLISDCKKGKIDKILIKAFHRLARNTTDCLTIIRDLKLMGVSVRSERERLDTENMSNEMLVMLWANMAQEESVSISKNMRWSYRKRMRAGEFITCKAPFGYELINGKELKPKPEEADIVRWVFDSYLRGISPEEIAKRLDVMGISTPERSKTWRPAAIRYILTNEKYIGDTLAQKNMSTDDFPFVKKPNKGEKDQYYIKNSHPAIISRDVFKKAKTLMAMRRPATGQMPKTYPLSGKIVCGECNAVFKRRQSASGYIAWVCRKHDRSRFNCAMPRIAETAIYSAFSRMTRKLKHYANIILEPTVSQLCELQSTLQRDHTGIVSIRQELANISEQAHTLSRLRRQSLLSDADWQTHMNEINTRQYELRRKLRTLIENDDLSQIIEDMERLMQVITEIEIEDNDFSEELFEDIVHKTEIGADGSIRFILPAGVIITEWLDEVQI